MKENETKRIQRLLRAYLENRCNEKEYRELLAILESSEHDRVLKQTLDRYWEELTDAPESPLGQVRPASADLWFEEIFTEARLREGRRRGPRQPVRRPHRSGMLLRVAAILVLALSLSLATLVMFPPIGSEDGGTSITWIERVADRGEKVRFMLPDGTQVHLNSGSVLRYNNQYGSTVREVRLEGEGFFTVARNEEIPFLVHTGEVQTRVLGTSFNVRSYRGEDGTSIAVTHGRVSVEPIAQSARSGPESRVEPLILEAGQWADYDRNSDRLDLGEGDLEHRTAWNEGVLLYHDKKLAEVATELERWYGVSIRFESEALRECIIRGEHRNEVLENVLNAIGYAFDIDYRIEGRDVTLSGEGCNPVNEQTIE